ncbi:MAG: DUF4239 domain-containing protein [Reyranella sp.]|nr:DUF4239 domain-containing protein [Reyranella sp.]
MIDWLYTFSELTLLAISAIILAVAIILLPHLIRRLPYMTPSDFNTDFVIRVQTTLFTMTSLVLAFTLVQADRNFREADALVQAEASQINGLDRLLTRYGDPGVAAIRLHLLAYAKSIVKDEWPAMLTDQGSEKTRALYVPVAQGILAIDPTTPRQIQIYAEMLKSLDGIAEVRDQRLNALGLGLPAIYWQVVLFSAFMVILVSATIEQTPFRAAVLAAQAAVLGAFIGFVFLMDQPFKGDTAVDADSIVQAIARMEGRTK